MVLDRFRVQNNNLHYREMSSCKDQSQNEGIETDLAC